MRTYTHFSFPYHFLFSFTIAGFLVCSSSTTFYVSAQSHKLSGKELRIALVDSIYDAAILHGLDPKDSLQYGYYFTDATEKHLENLKKKLEQDSFEIIKFSSGDYATQENNIWQLEAREHKIYTRDELLATDKQIRWLTYKFLIDQYKGITISSPETDAIKIPEEEFVSTVKSLDNEPLFTAGKTLVRKKSYDRSMVAFQECIDRHYKEDTSNYYMGIALVATNEFVEGIEHWERARNLNSRYLDAYIQLGLIFFENSHFNRALYNFQEADTIKPKDDFILYNISKCLLQLKQYNVSYDYAKRALAVNRKNMYVKGVLKILNSPQIKKKRRQNPSV